MRKLSSLLSVLILSACFVLPSSVLANPTGGLLLGVVSDNGAKSATDGNLATYEQMYNGYAPFGTWTLKSPTTIDAFYQKIFGGTIQLFDSKGTLLFQTTVKDSVTDQWTVMTPVENVKIVKLYASYGTGSAMYEMDIRSSNRIPDRDVPLTLGYNGVGSRINVVNYDKAKTVKSSSLLPYMYSTAPEKGI